MLFKIISIGVAQQQAAMFFRSVPKWELQENLKDIGRTFSSNFDPFSIKQNLFF